ncbi:GNAT family N-acetyltransferase [Candidatus Latescibacterota bacterium]
MAQNLTVSEIEDISLWDSFVESSPQGTIFSTSSWLKSAGKAHGGEPRIMGVWEGDQLVAGVSFIHVAHGPFKKASSPVMTPYGGIVFRPDSGKRRSEAESFNAVCAEHLIIDLSARYHHIFLVHSPGFTDIRPLTWAEWTGKIQYTYEIDITDTGKLWDHMERRVRKVIRKAESSLELCGKIDIEHFMELYERIYKDRGSEPPVERGRITSMVDEIMHSDFAEMRTVRGSGGQVISAVILVHDTDRVYTWISGSIPEKNATGAYSLQFWDAIKRHADVHKKLDMVGANIPSIAFFKKGFGGVLTPYYVTERYSSGMVRMAFNTYSKIKRFAR